MGFGSEVGRLLKELDKGILKAILGVSPILQPHHTYARDRVGIFFQYVIVTQPGKGLVSHRFISLLH